MVRYFHLSETKVYNSLKMFGGKPKFDQAISMLRQKFGYADQFEPVGNLFTDFELMKEVSDLLKQYGMKE